jgi:acyl-CoA reductase-like NAD-dependent aldehyde dehydrogenase
VKFEHKTYGLFIDGAFRAPVVQQHTQVRNPATGEIIATVASGSAADVDIAITAAMRAKQAWKQISAAERSDLLYRVAERILANEAHLAHVETLDSGKPIVETREDIRAIADQFKYFAGIIRSETGTFTKQDGAYMTLISREPYGVVGQIIPWNFPFLLAGWKLAPALAAGNCVVIKPAELTPLSLLELAELTKDILPAGVLNVVTGRGSVVGEHMVKHPDIQKIAFTGSTAVGKQISRSAADSVIPLSMELGGKSANIIFPDAPMAKAIEGATMGILYGQGQVCNAGSRVFVHRSIYDETVRALIAHFEKVKVGDPLDEATRMGTLISEAQMAVVSKYVETGIAEGATLAFGGKRMMQAPFDKGYYFEPTLFTHVTNDMRIAQEEIFGPVLVVIPFDSDEDVIAMANDSEYGLAGACWTRDIFRGLKIASAVDTGLFWINEYHLAPSGTPFGGFKKSGYGRDNDKSALEAYSQLKTIYISLSDSEVGWYR